MLVKNLTCAVCGDNAGTFEQHHNRDTGYGICLSCVRWLADVRKVDPEEIKKNYGTAGVNYENPYK